MVHLSSRVLRVGLVALAGSALSFTAHAQTTYTTDQANVDIKTASTATTTVDAEGAGANVTVSNDGSVNAGAAVIMDNTTPSSNYLVLDADGSYTAIATSSGGASATVEVTQAGTLQVDHSNSSITKTGGSGAALGVAANLTVTNSGTITVSGGTGTDVIDITAGTTTLVNEGNITGTVGSIDGIVQVGAAGTLDYTGMTGSTVSTDQTGVTVFDASASGATVSSFVNYGAIDANGATETAIDVTGDTAATTLFLGNGSNVTGLIKLGDTLSDTVQISGTVTFDGAIEGDATAGGNLDIDESITFAATGGSNTNITNINVADTKTFTLGDNVFDNSASNLDLALAGSGTMNITGKTGTAIDMGTGTFTIGSGATLTGDAAAVVDGDVTVAGTANLLTVSDSTVTNSGFINGLNLASGAAINISNTGAIQGNPTLNGGIVGAGNNTIALTNTGTISTTTDGDVAIDFSNAGTTISLFESSGDITAEDNADVAINVSGDTAANTLSFTGGTITGSIVLGGTASDTINISNTVALNGSISGDATVGGVLDIDEDFTLGGSGNTIQEIGVINIADGKTFTLGNNLIDNESSSMDITLEGAGTLDITGKSGIAIDATGQTLTIGASNTLVTDEAAVIEANMDISGVVSGTLSVDTATVTLNTGASVQSIYGSSGNVETLTLGGTYTNAGAISNVDVINVTGGSFTVSESVTGVDTNFNIGAARTATVNSQVSGTGVLTLAGTSTLDIAAGSSVTLGTLSATSGAQVNMDITQSSGNSYMSFATTGQDASNATLTVALTGQVAEGSITLVEGVDGGAFAAIAEETDSVLYTLTGSISGTEYVVFVDRTGFDELASNAQNVTVGAALEGLTSSTNTEISTLMTNLAAAAQSGTAQVDEIVESLNPSVDGLDSAAIEMQTSAMDTVADRLAYLRQGGESGVVTGDGMYSKHMWMQAFGSTADQDTRNGIKGYEATSYGFAAGVDSEEIVDGSVVGLSLAYGIGDVDSDAQSNAQTEIKSYQLGAYVSTDLNADLYTDLMASVAMNNYETERTVSGIGTAKGETDGVQGSVRAAVGRYLQMSDSFQLIPEASLQYTYLTMDKYTETGAGGAGLNVDPGDSSALIMALGGTAAWDFEHTSGSVIRAALRGKYSYDVIGDEFSTESTFIAGGTSFKTEGVKNAQHAFTAGAGITLLDASGVEVGLDYDATLKADYVNHAGTVKVRWAF